MNPKKELLWGLWGTLNPIDLKPENHARLERRDENASTPNPKPINL